MAQGGSDDVLLAAAARGEELAFMLLYERHRAPLFRFLRRLCGSVELAEDVTHDCFVGLIRRPSGFDSSRASLRTYLCTVARNLAFSRLRREGRESSLDDLDAGPLRLVDESPGPLEEMQSSELRGNVADAVARLPVLQREAIILFEYEEFTLAEIAQVAGADLWTIKSRLRRARASLRRSLSSQSSMPANCAKEAV